MRSALVIDKMRTTFQERYGQGVTAALHVPGAKEKRCRTHLERYGFEHTFQVEIFKQKRNTTRRTNMPKNFISRPEMRLKAFLEERFGEGAVKHQRWVNGSPIDFYVKTIDTYVQLDGRYWHGLDRPTEDIRLSERPRDQTIYQRLLNDRRQNGWFAEKGLSFVRITDEQLAVSGSACLDVLMPVRAT